MTESNRSKNDSFVVLLSVAVVLGMLVSAVVIYLWRNQPEVVEHGLGMQTAIALCPGFMLVHVVGGVDDTTLALLITSGTIVIANAALYGGVAALAYWGLVTFSPKRR